MYATEKYIKEGLNFSDIFAARQFAITSGGFAFDLKEVVDFIRIESKDFKVKDDDILSLDNSVRLIVERWKRENNMADAVIDEMEDAEIEEEIEENVLGGENENEEEDDEGEGEGKDDDDDEGEGEGTEDDDDDDELSEESVRESLKILESSLEFIEKDSDLGIAILEQMEILNDYLKIL